MCDAEIRFQRGAIAGSNADPVELRVASHWTLRSRAWGILGSGASTNLPESPVRFSICTFVGTPSCQVERVRAMAVSTLDEGQQVGVEFVRMRGGQSMWCARIDFQFGFLDDLRRQSS